jgi:hypothetical protein
MAAGYVEEAAMAAIAFNAVHQPEHRREQVDTVLAAQFQPLDPGIVSEAIPAFFIGRNQDGLWVARDAKGRIGGIFLLENSALAFARRHSQPGGCATIFPSHRFELDLENNGNLLASQLGSLLRLRRRMTAFLGRMTEAIKTPAG